MLSELSLFSGIGGFSLAGSWAGFTTIQFVEIDPYCQKVLAKNFPEVPIHGDIKTATVDIIANSWYNALSENERGEIMSASRSAKYEGASEMYNAGNSVGQCADYYGISRQAMWAILKRRGVAFRDHLKYGEDNHFFRGGETASERSHDIVEKAIKSGKLTPKPCEVCGSNGKFQDGRSAIQAHHDDYNYPLRVRWLCQKHHHAWHKDNKAIELEKEVNNGTQSNTTESALKKGIDLITGGFP